MPIEASEHFYSLLNRLFSAAKVEQLSEKDQNKIFEAFKEHVSHFPQVIDLRQKILFLGAEEYSPMELFEKYQCSSLIEKLRELQKQYLFIIDVPKAKSSKFKRKTITTYREVVADKTKVENQVNAENIFSNNIAEAFMIAKTPHLFQVKLREACKALYDEKINAGENLDSIKEKIRSLLQKCYQKMNEIHDKPDFLAVLAEAASSYMQGTFPPNIEEYDDTLKSMVSKSLLESTDNANEMLKDAYLLTRGMGYKVSSFDQFSRTQHRSYSEGSTRPNYSVAAVKKAINTYNEKYPDKPVNIDDYFKGKYDRNTFFIKEVEVACETIADEFKFLRNPKYSLPIVVNDEKKLVTPIYLLQDIYTNDMAIFKMLINKDKRKNFIENYKNHRHPLGTEKEVEYQLNRNGVLAKKNPEALINLIYLLEGQEIKLISEEKAQSLQNGDNILFYLETPHSIHYEDNPFTSTGFTSKAAFDYSMENKTYGVYHLQEAFPNYNQDLVPQHPFMGKFYSFILSRGDYDKYVSSLAMNVVQEHEAKKLQIHETIIDENEMTFIGGCVISTPPKQKVPSYPDLSNTWLNLTEEGKENYSKRYGLNESTYDALRNRLSDQLRQGEDPPKLRDIFIQSFLELLNDKSVPNSIRPSQPWKKSDVITYFKKNPFNIVTINAMVKEDDPQKLACIAQFEHYTRAKKAFHQLFAPVYEHMLKQFEQENIDYALQKGFKLLNISDQGKQYQAENMSSNTSYETEQELTLGRQMDSLSVSKSNKRQPH